MLCLQSKSNFQSKNSECSSIFFKKNADCPVCPANLNLNVVSGFFLLEAGWKTAIRRHEYVGMEMLFIGRWEKLLMRALSLSLSLSPSVPSLDSVFFFQHTLT